MSSELYFERKMFSFTCFFCWVLSWAAMTREKAFHSWVHISICICKSRGRRGRKVLNQNYVEKGISILREMSIPWYLLASQNETSLCFKIAVLQKVDSKILEWSFWTVSMKISMLFRNASIAKYWFTRKYLILKVTIRKYKLFLYSPGRRTLLLNWFLCQPPPSSLSSLCHWRNKVNWKLVASSTYYRSHTANHCKTPSVQGCWRTCPSYMLLCSSQLPSRVHRQLPAQQSQQ